MVYHTWSHTWRARHQLCWFRDSRPQKINWWKEGQCNVYWQYKKWIIAISLWTWIDLFHKRIVFTLEIPAQPWFVAWRSPETRVRGPQPALEGVWSQQTPVTGLSLAHTGARPSSASPGPGGVGDNSRGLGIVLDSSLWPMIRGVDVCSWLCAGTRARDGVGLSCAWCEEWEALRPGVRWGWGAPGQETETRQMCSRDPVAEAQETREPGAESSQQFNPLINSPWAKLCTVRKVSTFIQTKIQKVPCYYKNQKIDFLTCCGNGSTGYIYF